MTDTCPHCGQQMPQKRIWKESEVKEICRDRDQYAKFQTEIHAALEEKRIIFGE